MRRIKPRQNKSKTKTKSLNKAGQQRRHIQYSSKTARENMGKRKLHELLAQFDELYIVKGKKFYKLMLNGDHVGGCAKPTEITTVFTKNNNCFVKYTLNKPLNELEGAK